MVVNSPELDPLFRFIRVAIVKALGGREYVCLPNKSLEQYISIVNPNIPPLLYDFFVKFDYLYVLRQSNSTLNGEEPEVLLSAQDLIYEVQLTVM
ncbi:hypothetical protein [Vibrio lentus]|uniref:hypothetical protein n=1 Tax=Vibrio lentus TaxID=136468 RepID=UPI000C81C3FD|nr:hypothetical protein [Vibrio lentus]PML09486.1 hypothetical protein BCT85_16805 [Vibrio lentus]